MNIASYFCPFSNKFQAVKVFTQQLTRWERLKTLTVTALAALATLPLLGLGGVAAFRAMVRHYTPINPREPSNSPHESAASKIDTVIRPVLNEEPEQVDREPPRLFIAPKSQEYLKAQEKLVNDQKMLENLAKTQWRVEKETSWFQNWNPNWNPINWVFSQFPMPEELKDLKEISEVIATLERDIHAFMREISSVGDESDMALSLLRETCDRLIEVSGAIVALQQRHLRCGNDEQAQALNQVLNTINTLIGQLPREEGVESTKTFWERLGGTFGQSRKVKDLAWKVMKYETQIQELKKHIEDQFSSILKEDLESSWFLVGNEDDVVRRLHKILCEVEADSADDSRFSQEYLRQVRDLINERFIPAFRQEFGQNPDNPKLHQIAEILFTGVSLEKQCFDTLATFNQVGATVLGQPPEEIDDTAHGEHPFVKWVNTVYRRIGAVPYSAKAPLLNQWANSARGQWNRDFDPYRQGNPTHHFWNLRVGGKVVKMLGMGTPTNENGWSKASLNEEFIALMKRYKAVGKKHLFINNQNLIPKTGWLAYIINGDETARCNLILDKQDEEDVKGAYFAISLSKNSQFYGQKGEWAARDFAGAFKGNLFEQVCKGQRYITGSYIPETIRELIPEFDAKANNVIEKIHEKVFECKENLSVEERRWFIELFYDNLVKMIIVEGGFDSVNGSCKDQIDRGAGTNAQLAANCYIVDQENGELTQEQQEHVMMLMMVRALLVRKRPPLPERVERFAEGMDKSFKHVKQLKALHQSLFPDTPFVPLRVGSE